jgi:hypothetical protein
MPKPDPRATIHHDSNKSRESIPTPLNMFPKTHPIRPINSFKAPSSRQNGLCLDGFSICLLAGCLRVGRGVLRCGKRLLASFGAYGGKEIIEALRFGEDLGEDFILLLPHFVSLTTTYVSPFSFSFNDFLTPFSSYVFPFVYSQCTKGYLTLLMRLAYYLSKKKKKLGLVIQATPQEIPLQFFNLISNPNRDREEGKEISTRIVFKGISFSSNQTKYIKSCQRYLHSRACNFWARYD